MGSKRIGQVRFRAISGDHAGAGVPHLHADIGSGEVILELLADGSVRLSEAHGSPIRGRITIRELRVVLTTGASSYASLMDLWKESRGRL